MDKVSLLINFVWFKIYYLFDKKIKINLRQRISYSTEIRIQGNKSQLTIGNYLHTKRNVTIQSDGGDILIGDCVFINENCNIVCRESIVIESGVSIGPNVMIYDHDHDIKHGQGFLKAPIKIEKGVWIGANCLILKGVHIGEGAVIAAGTVLKYDVPSKTIAYNDRKLILKDII